MKAKIQRWGNSLGLRIPKAFTEEIGLAPGSQVDITVERGKLVVRPIDEESVDLAELLEQITPENVHEEIQTGPPVGKEIW